MAKKKKQQEQIKRLVIEVTMDQYDTIKQIGVDEYHGLSATKTAKVFVEEAIQEYILG